MRKYPLSSLLLRFYQKNILYGPIIWNYKDYQKQIKLLSELTSKLQSKSKLDSDINLLFVIL